MSVMKNTKSEPQITFQLKSIELLDFKLDQPVQPLSAQTTFHYNINLEQRIDPDKKWVIVVTSVDTIHEDSKACLGSLKASCVFEIANFDDFRSKKTQQISLPDNLAVMLNSISISTIRGVMFSQFKGTFLQNAILPIIDSNSFEKKDI